jgi:hypothetical protein
MIFDEDRMHTVSPEFREPGDFKPDKAKTVKVILINSSYV